MKRKKSFGFTLLELMIVLVIVGVLATLAAPNYSRMIARNRLRAVANEWRGAFYLAQKEAIRRKHRVQLCASTDGQSCTGGNDFSAGWIVIDNNGVGNNGVATVIRDYPYLTAAEGNKNVVNLAVANGVNLNFLANGRLPNNFAGGSLTVTNTDFNDIGVTLNISRGGRIRAE